VGNQRKIHSPPVVGSITKEQAIAAAHKVSVCSKCGNAGTMNIFAGNRYCDPCAEKGITINGIKISKGDPDKRLFYYADVMSKHIDDINNPDKE
jgi:hypothetical protein